MAPYKSPFADPSAVQKIAGDLKTLSTKSVDIEEGIVKAKRQVDEIFQKYGSDFSILSEIPSFFSEFSKVIVFYAAPATSSVHETVCLRISPKQATSPAMWPQKSNLNLTVICQFRIFAYTALHVFWYMQIFL